MTNKVEQVANEIKAGTRKSIFDVNFTLEEYLSKIDNNTTLLELLLKNNIYIYETNKFETSLEAALIYIKLDKSLWNFKLSEEQLLTKLNDKTILEILIEKNEPLSEHIKRIKNDLEIIDILISNDKFFQLSYLSQEIIEKLMTPNALREYPLEKYFNNERAIEYIIPLINKPKELIDLCKKHNQEHQLIKVHEDVLMYPINDNETLLDELLNKKQIPVSLNNIPPNTNFIKYLIDKNLYEYLNEANENILMIKIETDKTLLEFLIEHNKIAEIKTTISSSDIINMLNKNNKLNLITNANTTLLLSKAAELIKDNNITSDETFLEYMLKNGYNPILYTKRFFNDEILKIICEKGYYEYLNNKCLEDAQLLIQLSDGSMIIDKILDNNINIDFVYQGFESDIVAKKIFEKNRFDLLVKSNIELLFTNVDTNHNYLDYILESIKSKQTKYNVNDILKYNISNSNKAKFYIALAQHNMTEYVNDLTEKDLLKESEGKTLLDELLDLNSELTINEVLSDSVKANMKIAVILKSRNLEQESIDIPLENSSITQDYLIEIENRHGIGPLLNEGEFLLNRLYELFITDGKSDSTIVAALISGYRQALITNYNLSIHELKKLVEVKEKNFETFIYYKDESKGAYFSPSNGYVFCDKPVITTVLHETGHALHHYLAESTAPNNYHDIIEKIKANPETIKKVEEYANKYNDLKNKIKELTEKQYHQFFVTYFNDEKIKEIEEFLKQTEIEKKEEFKELGLPEATLKTILCNICTTEEYINQQKRMYINKYSEDILRSEMGGFITIGDMIDAIYIGELHSGVLQNENGDKIHRTVGHGISYYSNPHHGFDEMLANFAAIIKGSDAKETIELLKSIVGDDLYNMLDEFYRQNIIKEDALEKGKTL